MSRLLRLANPVHRLHGTPMRPDPSLVYDHWSLLARYAGTVARAGVTSDVAGLGTFAYACGSTECVDLR